MLGQNVAESQCGVGPVIGDGSVYALLNLVQRHRGAVVEQEIVSVYTVLCTAVGYEQVIQSAGFILSQVELLGIYFRSAVAVLTQEMAQACSSENVVCLA